MTAALCFCSGFYGLFNVFYTLQSATTFATGSGEAIPPLARHAFFVGQTIANGRHFITPCMVVTHLGRLAGAGFFLRFDARGFLAALAEDREDLKLLPVFLKLQSFLGFFLVIVMVGHGTAYDFLTALRRAKLALSALARRSCSRWDFALDAAVLVGFGVGWVIGSAVHEEG